MSTRSRKIDFQISMAWNIVSRFSVITVLSNHLLDSGLCLSMYVWQGFQFGTASVHNISSILYFLCWRMALRGERLLIQI